MAVSTMEAFRGVWLPAFRCSSGHSSHADMPEYRRRA